MGKRKIILFVLLILGILLASVIGIFVTTGGGGLVRVGWRILKRQEGDTFSWKQFVDRGAGAQISGFYAGSRGETIYLWTLSGLKSYRHKEGASVYTHLDICGAILKLSESKGSLQKGASIEAVKRVFFEPREWVSVMRPGDYAWVIAGVGEMQKDEILRAFGNNNRYYPETNLTEKQCR